MPTPASGDAAPGRLIDQSIGYGWPGGFRGRGPLRAAAPFNWQASAGLQVHGPPLTFTD